MNLKPHMESLGSEHYALGNGSNAAREDERCDPTRSMNIAVSLISGLRLWASRPGPTAAVLAGGIEIATSREILNCEHLSPLGHMATVFNNRLPPSLERAARLIRLVQWRLPNVRFTVWGSQGDLRASDRESHQAWLSRVLRGIIGSHLRTGGVDMFYVVENPFVSIRDYTFPLTSCRHPNAHECVLTAHVECDIQVYGVGSGGRGTARTASSHRFEASL